VPIMEILSWRYMTTKINAAKMGSMLIRNVSNDFDELMRDNSAKAMTVTVNDHRIGTNITTAV